MVSGNDVRGGLRSETDLSAFRKFARPIHDQRKRMADNRRIDMCATYRDSDETLKKDNTRRQTTVLYIHGLPFSFFYFFNT